MEPVEPTEGESSQADLAMMRCRLPSSPHSSSGLWLLAITLGKAPRSKRYRPVFGSSLLDSRSADRYSCRSADGPAAPPGHWYATDREFRAIFQHVLDGIVYPRHDQGTCLDANPDAFALLRLPRAACGSPFAQVLCARKTPA